MSLNLEDSAALTQRGPDRAVSEDAVVLLPQDHLAAVVAGMGGAGAGAGNITRAALTRAAPALTRSAR